jgi:hypothetical protein
VRHGSAGIDKSVRGLDCRLGSVGFRERPKNPPNDIGHPFSLQRGHHVLNLYEAILIDTSASISRDGKTNALFREYLVAARSLLSTEPPNTRV